MVTEKVKNIFCFIDFLQSNIALFNKQKTLLAQIDDLRKAYNDLDPKTNFEHKFEREVIAEKGDKLVNSFCSNCKNLINEKINSLEITDLSNLGNNHFYNIGELVILVETQKYDQEDVKLILDAKSKYVSILENLQLRQHIFNNQSFPLTKHLLLFQIQSHSAKHIRNPHKFHPQRNQLIGQPVQTYQ